MKEPVRNVSVILVLSFILANLTGCRKMENPVKYQMGTFSDSVYNLTGINSQYDDYNSTLYILSSSNLYILGSSISIIFSSNRGSLGGQFDLVQGGILFQFDQTTGTFEIRSEMINDPFFSVLINKANTEGNDLGPYSFFSSSDGYEYLLLSSQNAGGPLDLYYLKYLPRFGNGIPEVHGPNPVRLLNSNFEDAYISLDANEDSAYFTSDRGGNFDIYLHERSSGINIDSWFSQDFTASVKVDSVNSDYDDKCPLVFRNIMLFTSNRPGGQGGYDLYYSLFKKGNWSAPVNFGPKINSSSDEYRPLLGYHTDFTNLCLVFSSDRPGGLGGFDLYFAGFELSK